MGARLSHPASLLRSRYGIVVVGSGYGGAITAARLAQAGHDVCILERGKEWLPGEFPDRSPTVVAELRTPHNPLGLYEYIFGDDVDIFCGNGLGGTSLVNANVVIRPSTDVFQHPRWPRAIREEAATGKLTRHFDEVTRMLGATTMPDLEGQPLGKVAAHERSAQGRPGEFSSLRLAVTFAGKNEKQTGQTPCTLCGDCITGCNVGAKNTLPMNYLPHARKHGAEIYTQLEVDFLVPAAEGGYHVFAWHRSADKGVGPGMGTGASTAVRVLLHARVVILAAGVMGTTGILLRSRARGLALSRHLGHAFSANGDLLGIGYNNDVRTEAVGVGTRPGAPEKLVDKQADRQADKQANRQAGRQAVGPTITSMIDYRMVEDAASQFIIEEGAFPSGIVELLRRVVPKIAFTRGQDTDGGRRDQALELSRIMRDLVRDDREGALNHSMIYLGMGHDEADGRIVLGPDGAARVLWGAAPDRPVFHKLGEEMHALVAALGGTYIANPRGEDWMSNNEVTVHPLGGCPMGEDRHSGAVDHAGRVFHGQAASATAVHEGLLVADASIIPTSLGVNPMLTISALAERIAERFLAAHTEPVRPYEGELESPVVAVPRPGLEFRERLRGYCTRNVTWARTPAGFETAEAQARREGVRMDLSLMILIEDLDAFLAVPQHTAMAEGDVDSAMFGVKRRVEEGTFQFFVEDAGGKQEKRMVYRLAFVGADGERYLLDAFKLVSGRSGHDVWSANTTLFTSIREGWSEDDPIIAQGVLRVRPRDFIEQLSTFRVRNSRDAAQAAAYLARFGQFFFGELWDAYVALHWAGRLGQQARSQE